MKKLVIAAGAAALGLAASSAALAHHSGAMFDSEKSVTVSGTVKQFQYTNPHAWLVLSVPDAAGKVTTWSFEMGELSSLTRAGIHKQDFAPGTKVTVTGRPMKDGRPAGAFTKAVRADGVEFTPRGSTRPAGAAG